MGNCNNCNPCGGNNIGHVGTPINSGDNPITDSGVACTPTGDYFYDKIISLSATPAYGNEGPLRVCQAERWAVGMWVKTIKGTFRVVAVDQTNNTITVRNSCDDGSEIAGNSIGGEELSEGSIIWPINEPICKTPLEPQDSGNILVQPPSCNPSADQDPGILRPVIVGPNEDIDNCLKTLAYKSELVKDSDDCCVETLRYYEFDVARNRIGDMKSSLLQNDHEGWIVADGRRLSMAEYPNIQFLADAGIICVEDGMYVMPDMRGRVIRGTDLGTGRDVDAATRYSAVDGCAGGDRPGTYQEHSQQQVKYRSTFTDNVNTYNLVTIDGSTRYVIDGDPSGQPVGNTLDAAFLGSGSSSTEQTVIAEETLEGIECESSGVDNPTTEDDGMGGEVEVYEIQYACETRMKNISATHFIYVGKAEEICI